MGLPFLIFVLASASLTSCGCCESSDSTVSGLDSIFKEIGFSPACVSQSLAFCEGFSKDSFLLGKTLYLESLKKVINSQNQIQKRANNCADLFDLGDKESGVRTVYPFSCENRPVSVFCDQTTDGGGWTVIQHREALPEREKFYRDWVEYQLGFGNLEGEFWLGLNNIHALVSTTLMELRVDLEDFDGKKRWAKYDYFYVGNADDKYSLSLGSYSGNAGDALTGHNGNLFSAKDQDNDKMTAGSCAVNHKGAWWYGHCHSSNLNGHPYEGNHTSYADGINWQQFRGYHNSLKVASLGIRSKF